jgi:hypothetical protein
MEEWMIISKYSRPLHYLELSGQLNAATALLLDKGPCYQLTGVYVSSRFCLDNVERRKISP